MILGSVRVGLASLAKRLVKLAPRFVLTGARRHRLDHVLDRARQRLHLVAESFDVEEQGVLRPCELVDGRAQADDLVAHSGQRGFGGLMRWGGRSRSGTSCLDGEGSLSAACANRKRREVAEGIISPDC